MKFLKELIDEKRNEEDFNYFDFNQFSNLEKIDKRIHGTLIKSNWENRKITAVLKNLNNSKITENGFKEFITKVWIMLLLFFMVKYLKKLFYNTVKSFW